MARRITQGTRGEATPRAAHNYQIVELSGKKRDGILPLLTLPVGSGFQVKLSIAGSVDEWLKSKYEKSLVLAAMSKQEVVGCAILSYSPEFEDAWYVHHVRICGQHQRRGILTSLVQEVLNGRYLPAETKYFCSLASSNSSLVKRLKVKYSLERYASLYTACIPAENLPQDLSCSKLNRFQNLELVYSGVRGMLLELVLRSWTWYIGHCGRAAPGDKELYYCEDITQLQRTGNLSLQGDAWILSSTFQKHQLKSLRACRWFFTYKTELLGTPNSLNVSKIPLRLL